ncbi:Ctr copper transporter family-domain-containing protein [Cristinia sonorae]|uniref:Copper transport protein n=1 Tax=Cristinia sonorae TaxID=1940300 RepID=A0A8K0UPI1_9AGAR|nr:Ctr copper transporter family-domain-containing protein [Cristinia sonorae]
MDIDASESTSSPWSSFVMETMRVPFPDTRGPACTELALYWICRCITSQCYSRVLYSTLDCKGDSAMPVPWRLLHCAPDLSAVLCHLCVCAPSAQSPHPFRAHVTQRYLSATPARHITSAITRESLIPLYHTVQLFKLSVMDMNDNGDTPSAARAEVMMTPWLHFSGGDNLFFKSWHPSSGGAIAGACVALVALALVERWVSGMRGSLESYWRQKTLAAMTGRSHTYPPAATSPAKDEVEVDTSNLPAHAPAAAHNAKRTRIIPPFIASHDLPRGVAFALQSLLAYLLMLAVMTFQAAYFIAIVVGLGIGEMLFGRMGSAHVH